MKGDFSRNTYRPASQYSRVMMQQGRVQIDADWNEQTSILLGYMRALTRDLFGAHAGPQDECGFKIVGSANRESLIPSESAMVGEALKREGKHLGDKDMMLLPGRYYVGGLPVELDRPMLLTDQFGSEPEGAKTKRPASAGWFAYLDVWEDYVSADQDEYIREGALGGADTCGRARINWRVQVMLDPKADSPLSALARSKEALIKVIAKSTETSESLCSIDPDARYRGPENQLYRIEIQTGSDADAPTFKWSRDNGAVTFPVLVSQGTTLTLAHLGRDQATGLVVGDWVELIDDARQAAFGVGQMAQVSAIDAHDLIVTLKPADPAVGLRAYLEGEASELHALLRRWDHRGQATEEGKGAITAKPGENIELEDGIFATFKEGDFRAGDYWLIPARVLTGDVEWEELADADGFRPPDGPHHFYAPLARRSGDGIEDLRCQIARLPCVSK